MFAGQESARPLEDAAIDPITFEVIKHRLWQINDEQGLAIKTISSSPVVVEGNDFNVGLFTAEGQLCTAGAGSLVHVATMGKTLKSILELAGEIEDGDVFLTNDPFLGALHQSDVVIASPLFLDGRILLWASNVLHHPDVGGIDEGSFCISARTLYQEPPRYFLKIVARGRLQPEVEHTFVTNSRLPEMVALDLRAQIGAIHVVKQRLAELIAERGGAVVQAVMRRSIDVAEEQLREKIAGLPEGSWTGQAFMDGVRVGDERIVRVQVTLTHEGDRLKFDYTGSDPQVDAAVNCTYHACVAATAVPLYSYLCQGDVDWNEGLMRCLDVVAPEGSVVNATFPAPVSICTIGFRWLATVAAAQAVAKMFDASPQHRDRVCSSWSVSGNCNNVFGLDASGRRVGALLSDHRGGGAGARSFADGISHAGQVTSYSSNMGNVESAEWKLPLLYLFRRQLPDSGGAGRFRGGLSSIAAIMPYGVPELILKATNTAGTDETNAHGIGGGYPGAGSQTIVVHDSKALELLQQRRLETDFHALGGAVEYLPSKADRRLGAHDVLVFYPPGGGGYGDPLRRDPQAVARDIASGWVSRESAQALYGVRLSADGKVDLEATDALRRDLSRRRCDGDAASLMPEFMPPARAEGGSQQVGDQIAGVGQGGGAVLTCMSCGHALSGPAGRVVTKRASMGKAGPWAAARFGGESPNFVLQERACSSCGQLFDVQEVRT
jgi:N-methylhydantoinase B